MKERQDQIVFYAVLSGLGGCLLFWVIPNFIRIKPNAAIGPEAFPQLVTMILIGLSLAGLVMEYHALRAEGGSFRGYRIQWRNYLPQAIFLLSGIGFLLAAPVLGFVPSAVIFLLFLLFFFGSKRKLVNLITAAVYPVVLYLIFSQVLRISFPAGIFGF